MNKIISHLTLTNYRKKQADLVGLGSLPWKPQGDQHHKTRLRNNGLSSKHYGKKEPDFYLNRRGNDYKYRDRQSLLGSLTLTEL